MEEGFRGRGGMDAMLFEFLARHGIATRLLNIGVEPGYRFELGTRTELHEQVGIGVSAVTRRATDFLRTIAPECIRPKVISAGES
jgi:transketolase